MFGKYNDDLSKTSYNRVAKDGEYTYFEMDNWDGIYKLVNKTDDEMWKINERFIDNQLNRNVSLYFSHNPLQADGFFKREVDYLTIKIAEKKKTISFIKEGNYWKAIW